MSLDIQTVLFAIGLIAVVFIMLHFQSRRLELTLESLKTDDSKELLLQWLAEMRNGLDRNTDMMNRQLAHASESLNQRLDSTAQLLRLLNTDLGQVHEVGEQMRDFQIFFRSPKIRGKIGEHIMSEILQQVLPTRTFQLQYRFNSGVIVDALVQLQSGSIPIDAKFPLENFQKAAAASSPEVTQSFKNQFWRDVRKHLGSISKKYILPAEGTLEFAVMYVPSETLYYEMLTNDDLIAEAENKNVLIVSPNSFYYFLKLVLVGLFSHKIEKTAAQVLRNLKMLQRDGESLSGEMSTLFTHLNNSRNSGERLYHKIEELQRRLEEINEIGNDADD